MADSRQLAKPRLGRGLSSLIINSAARIEDTALDQAAMVAVQTSAPAASPASPAEPASPAATEPASPAVATLDAPAQAAAGPSQPAEGAAKVEQTGRDYVPQAAQQPAATDKPAGGSGTPIELPVTRIAPNPYQPRREFSSDDLRDLAQSIKQQGILQPLVVTHASGNAGNGQDSFVLIAGERRLRAARQAGLTKVPCIIRQATRQQMLEWALIENIQRADLNPVEKALAYQDYMDRFQLSVADAAEKLGQARTTVANFLRVLELPDEVQAMLVGGQLSFGHAKVLAGLAGAPDRQSELARRVVAETLSVRQLETLATAPPPAQADPAVPSVAKVIKSKAAYLRDLEEQLSRVIGTKVFVMPGRAKNTGRLVIEYYNLDDFDRISEKLGLSIES